MAYERLFQQAADEFKILSQASDYAPVSGEGAYREVKLDGTNPGNHFLLLETSSQIGLQITVAFGILLEESLYVSDQIEIQLPLTIVPEETTFTATAYFRTRSTKVASTPTTIQYRVDCLTTKRQITDWTSIAVPDSSNTIVITSTSIAVPDSSNTIVITSTENQILDDANQWETKQLTVKVDSGLTTQAIKPVRWKVQNLTGIT
jgi:hypothetical protein